MNEKNAKWLLTINICTLVTALVAIAGFSGSMWYSRQSLDYTTKTFVELTKQRELEEKKFLKDRSDRAQDNKNRIEEAKASRAPFLSVARCCNQVPIVFFETIDLHIGVIDLDPDPKSSFLKYPNYNSGFVAEITNFGSGAAMETKLIWHPEKIEYVSGEVKEFTIDEAADESYERPYSWPNYIGSGKTAAIKHIPRCISDDRERRINSVSGVVEIVCRDIVGEPYRFWQNFTIDPAYVGTVDGPPRLSAHFLELRNDSSLRPHTVAKPVTPQQ